MSRSARWQLPWRNRHEADPEGPLAQTAPVGIIGSGVLVGQLSTVAP